MSGNIKYRAAVIQHISQISRLESFGVPDEVITNLTESFKRTCAMAYDTGFLEGATDDLTKLLGRKGLRRAYNIANTEERRKQEKSRKNYALTFDVENLKVTNDTLGSSIGDTVIIATVQIILDSVRDTDKVARTGGDEFTAFLMGVDNDDVLNRIKDRIIKAHRKYGCVSSPIGPYPFNFRYTTIEIPEDPNLDKKDPDLDAKDQHFDHIVTLLDAKKGNKIEVRHSHRELSL